MELTPTNPNPPKSVQGKLNSTSGNLIRLVRGTYQLSGQTSLKLPQIDQMSHFLSNEVYFPIFSDLNPSNRLKIAKRVSDLLDCKSEGREALQTTLEEWVNFVSAMKITAQEIGSAYQMALRQELENGRGEIIKVFPMMSLPQTGEILGSYLRAKKKNFLYQQQREILLKWETQAFENSPARKLQRSRYWCDRLGDLLTSIQNGEPEHKLAGACMELEQLLTEKGFLAPWDKDNPEMVYILQMETKRLVEAEYGEMMTKRSRVNRYSDQGREITHLFNQLQKELLPPSTRAIFNVRKRRCYQCFLEHFSEIKDLHQQWDQRIKKQEALPAPNIVLD